MAKVADRLLSRPEHQARRLLDRVDDLERRTQIEVGSLQARIDALEAIQNQRDLELRTLNDHWERLNHLVVDLERRVRESEIGVSEAIHTTDRILGHVIDETAIERRLAAIEDRLMLGNPPPASDR